MGPKAPAKASSTALCIARVAFAQIGPGATLRTFRPCASPRALAAVNVSAMASQRARRAQCHRSNELERSLGDAKEQGTLLGLSTPVHKLAATNPCTWCMRLRAWPRLIGNSSSQRDERTRYRV
jgi:hypothetical protein